MNRHSILVPVFLAVLLVSGCASVNVPEEPSVKPTIDAYTLISEHEARLGEDHVAELTFRKYSEPGIFKSYVEALNGSSAARIDANYSGPECSGCLFNVSVGKVSMCECETASCSDRKCNVTEDGSWEAVDERFVEDCDDVSKYVVLGALWKGNVFRCVEGSYSDVFYLQVDGIALDTR